MNDARGHDPRARALRWRRSRWLAVAAGATLLVVGHGNPSSADPTVVGQTFDQAAARVPVLAYYYIWYDPTSWNRAKTDLPLAGKYSSDERTVMSEHVLTAKAAGIEGFIVSWKRTEKLDRRLAALAEVAEANDFTLMVIYQGLDFDREPLPARRVADDLDHFIRTFGSRPAFDMFDKPAVVLSGSWRFSRDDVEEIGRERRNSLLLLGSEKDAEGIVRLDGLIDGDAYYWSSVQPDTQRGYQERLDAMGAAVHHQRGVWIAPAAVGFDARLIGGTTVVERNDGATLTQEYSTAMASDPDAVGLISWNEFSENSHIEPSRNFGTRYVEVLAELLNGIPPEQVKAVDPFDSSSPGNRGSGVPQMTALTLVGATILAGVTVSSLRRRSGSVG